MVEASDEDEDDGREHHDELERVVWVRRDAVLELVPEPVEPRYLRRHVPWQVPSGLEHLLLRHRRILIIPLRLREHADVLQAVSYAVLQGGEEPAAAVPALQPPVGGDLTHRRTPIRRGRVNARRRPLVPAASKLSSKVSSAVADSC